MRLKTDLRITSGQKGKSLESYIDIKTQKRQAGTTSLHTSELRASPMFSQEVTMMSQKMTLSL